jgi:hypothetical protein
MIALPHRRTSLPVNTDRAHAQRSVESHSWSAEVQQRPSKWRRVYKTTTTKSACNILPCLAAALGHSATRPICEGGLSHCKFSLSLAFFYMLSFICLFLSFFICIELKRCFGKFTHTQTHTHTHTHRFSFRNVPPNSRTQPRTLCRRCASLCAGHRRSAGCSGPVRGHVL